MNTGVERGDGIVLGVRDVQSEHLEAGATSIGNECVSNEQLGFKRATGLR